MGWHGWAGGPRRRAGRRRRVTTTLVAASAVALLALGTTSCLSPSQQRALDLVNAERRERDLSALSPSQTATAKAQAWAEHLASEDDLYHSTLSDGITVRWCSLGENVGYGPTIAAVQHAYMASSTHRANILRPGWTAVGTGVARRGDKVWVVQEFLRAC